MWVDGGEGEGGGQIVRSAVALAMVTGQDVTVDNIRARRARPGLMRQHLTAVQAAAKICQAQVRGASVGSSRLTFQPGTVVAGDYSFSIGTAGSTTLVLETLLPALLVANRPSSLRLRGGTHNQLAPPFEYFSRVLTPLLERMGARMHVQLVRHGFYPAGGGEIHVEVYPPASLQGFDLLQRGELVTPNVTVLLSRLPTHIAEREIATIAAASNWPTTCFQTQLITNAASPGNVVLVELQCQHITELFTGFGEKGVPAEAVAAAAWNEAADYLAADVPVGPHLADQWMLLLALAAHCGRGGSFLTGPLTPHSETHLLIIQKFLNVPLQKENAGDKQVVVRIGS